MATKILRVQRAEDAGNAGVRPSIAVESNLDALAVTGLWRLQWLPKDRKFNAPFLVTKLLTLEIT